MDSSGKVRNIIRELSILRLSAMENNFFTTKLHQVIVANKKGKPLSSCRGVFLVMDYVPDDLKKMLDEIKTGDFSEDHVKVIMYNILCSLNFVGSTNLMHRDIKPQNILIDSNCMITLCDFGQARTLTNSPEYQKPTPTDDLFHKIKGAVGPDSDTEDTTPNTSDEIPQQILKGDKEFVSTRRLSMHI